MLHSFRTDVVKVYVGASHGLVTGEMLMMYNNSY